MIYQELKATKRACPVFARLAECEVTGQAGLTIARSPGGQHATGNGHDAPCAASVTAPPILASPTTSSNRQHRYHSITLMTSGNSPSR